MTVLKGVVLTSSAVVKNNLLNSSQIYSLDKKVAVYGIRVRLKTGMG